MHLSNFTVVRFGCNGSSSGRYRRNGVAGGATEATIGEETGSADTDTVVVFVAVVIVAVSAESRDVDEDVDKGVDDVTETACVLTNDV